MSVAFAMLAVVAAVAQEPSPPPESARIDPGEVPAITLPGVASVAVNDDATALFANPAGINRSIPAGFYFAWGKSEQPGPHHGTIGMTAGPIGFGYQRFRLGGGDHLSRTVIALGGNTRGPFSIGVRGARESIRWQGPDSRAWRWDAGMLWRPRWFASVGLVASDLNQARLAEGFDLYRRTYTAGVAVRPLPADRGARLTLFADIQGTETMRWSDEALLQTGLQVEPIAGFLLSGSVAGPLSGIADERTWRAGIGIRSRQATASAGFLFDATDDHRRSVYAVHTTPARQRSVLPQPSIARIRLAGTYADGAQRGLSLPIVGSPSQTGIAPVLQQLRRAERDQDVRGLLLEVESISMGALAEEVRAGIARVRAEGKPVVAWIESGAGTTQYYVASACDRIVIDPVGDISALGFRADILYFGALFDTLGIEFEKVAHGRFKTAGEQLILPNASEGQRESFDAVIDDIRDRLLDQVALDRGIPRDRLETLADGRILRAPQALEAGLVDSLGDRKAAERILGRLANRGEEPDLVSIAGWTYRKDAWHDGDKVAVVWLDGPIESGRSRRGFFTPNTIGSETVVRQLESLKDRGDIGAVVLRIDSPGGSGLASDQIWRAVEEVKAEGKPVIASMARVAASGGYYIACGADEIFADPTTITGSIGVLGLKLNLAGFYERNHIGVATFERGDMMGMYSTATPMRPEERAHLEENIDSFYEHFLGRVTAGRPLSRDQVDAVAQGRIWTGRQALEHRLIDQLGGLAEAIARARDLAGLSGDAPTENVRAPGFTFMDRLLDSAEIVARGAGSLARVCAPADRQLGDRPPPARIAAAEVEALRAFSPGIAGFAATPFDRWMLGRWIAERERPGAHAEWRAENPWLESLREAF